MRGHGYADAVSALEGRYAPRRSTRGRRSYTEGPERAERLWVAAAVVCEEMMLYGGSIHRRKRETEE